MIIRTALLLLPLMLLAFAQDAIKIESASAARNPLDGLGAGVVWACSDPELLPEGSNQAETRKSATANKGFDRTKALDDALARAKAENKVVFWYCPRVTAGLQGRQMYRPAILDNYALATWFSDPECVAMLNRRTIAVRLTCDAALGKRFDITGPERVEPMIAILKTDGTIALLKDGLRTFNTGWFEHFLSDALSAAGATGPSTETGAALQALKEGKGSDLAVAQAWLADGALAKAQTALPSFFSGISTAKVTEADDGVALVRAAVLRRLGDPAAALTALAALEKPGAAVRLERARSLLLLRNLDEALEELTSVRRGRDQTEAHWLRAVCQHFLRNDTMAEHEWRQAAAGPEDNSFTARAAACVMDGRDLTPVGPMPHGFEDPFPVRMPHNAAASGTSMPRPVKDARAIAPDALHYLLSLQRENGGWTDSRYAYWPTPDLTPNAWMAATALSMAALLEWRDVAPDRVERALEIGERYLFDERKMNRGSNEEIYADAYRLLYLTKKHARATSDSDKAATMERMKAVTGELARTQTTGKAKGFWAHEYSNPFSTGAVMDILLQARDAGVPIAPSLLHDGAEALLSTRSKTGAFAYGAGRPPGDSEEAAKNSMTRAAICEAAILRSGHQQGSAEKLEAAISTFWKFQPRLERVRRCDFHTDGELAGFFFWHSLYHTSNAMAAAPAASAASHKAKLLEYLVTLQEIDGSFLDSHEMGKAVGTAYGLLTLANLLQAQN